MVGIVNRLRYFGKKEEFPVQEFLFKEYDQLRNEIMTRTGIQHQLITFTLAAAGVFLALESGISHLLYPVLACFLAVAWMQNDKRIGELGCYIWEKIEPKDLEIGWEHYNKAHKPERTFAGSFAHFASLGIFCGSQIVLLATSFLYGPLSSNELILFGVDIGIIICTIMIVRPKDPACKADQNTDKTITITITSDNNVNENRSIQ